MIDIMLRNLKLVDKFGESENIDIAKGKNKTALTFKEAWLKRKI